VRRKTGAPARSLRSAKLMMWTATAASTQGGNVRSSQTYSDELHMIAGTVAVIGLDPAKTSFNCMGSMLTVEFWFAARYVVISY
jgi:hypothetical protein